MKKILIIICVLAFCNLHAQHLTIGQNIKHSVALGCISLGLNTGATLFSLYAPEGSPDSGVRKQDYVIALYASGAACAIASIYHLWRAGDKMDEKRIGFSSTGIGFKYSF